nr:Chain P, HIV-1 V3 LOOP PEPTIDE ANTIGEN [synthetic construct]1GGI_Q Chain Q, HIV-1 V3 LOOP PEPTIDE ANTIGEN [synthetic construct]1NAK_P Chain P, Peptide MP1 [synthetic construct]1NAK_Q Chain Q, Peptide MP1 [synthetic construct]1Q1J_P Chain P, gp120 V3 peptide [synthetic construct]1Q1J_Q Chain Q, gp120 V3 peptide [synthetic construct]
CKRIHIGPGRAFYTTC